MLEPSKGMKMASHHADEDNVHRTSVLQPPQLAVSSIPSSNNSLLSNTNQYQRPPSLYGSCHHPPQDCDVMMLESDSDDDDDGDRMNHDVFQLLPPPPPPPPSTTKSRILSVYHSCFYGIAPKVPLFVVGSVPHSILVATTIGIACGVSAYLYNVILQYSLITVWKTWSQQLLFILFGTTSELTTASLPTWTILWIPVVAIILAIGLGYTVRYVGEPGDLASTIQCVHLHGWIELNHALPMTIASLFSIVAGASVGPEAALVAVCATLAGFISQTIFRINPKLQRNLVRKHTLMGMAGALAAFFGSPLGGSLFALEVCSRFGVEYYEHTLEAILCGEITLTVFRTLSHAPPSAIWSITSTEHRLTAAYPIYILIGAMIGVMGATISSIFGYIHKTFVMSTMARYHLMDRQNTVRRAMVGVSVFVAVGLLVPQTLFWSEEEFQNIATMDAIASFPHIWPATSITGFEMHNFITALIVGVAKLVTISFSIAGGFRGGVIFPLFASGAAFGRALHALCPFLPVQVCVLCFAAAIQVPITRTALSTSIILTYLSGEPQALAAILAASLVSLFCTVNTPVLIMTQVPRLDLEGSMHHHSTLPSPIMISTKTAHTNHSVGTGNDDAACMGSNV